ncbi:MAG: hypothetical protein WBD99_11040 [Thermodesulfobacteriota bacterium]
MKGNSDPLGLGAVKDDISNLRSDVKELFQKLIDTGKSETEAAKDKVIEELGDALQVASKSGKETVESLQSKVQEKPFISLLLSFFIGFFFGVFFNRK